MKEETSGLVRLLKMIVKFVLCWWLFCLLFWGIAIVLVAAFTLIN
jgi:hypothetical protein